MAPVVPHSQIRAGKVARLVPVQVWVPEDCGRLTHLLAAHPLRVKIAIGQDPHAAIPRVA